MNWHPEVLAPTQRKVLDLIAGVCASEGFVLHGGTALALRIGHRMSEDFDWFCDKPLREPISLAQKLKSAGIAFDTTRVAEGTLHGSVHGVKISFLEYLVSESSPAEDSPDGAFRTGSLDDIATEKLMAIATRGSRKDLIDIYCLVEKHRPLSEFIRLFKKRYAIKDVSTVFMGLNYFEDAEKVAMPKMLQPVKWAQIRKTLQKWVQEASKLERKGKNV